MLEVHSKGHHCLLVWQGPHVYREVQFAVVFLSVRELPYSQPLIYCSSMLACNQRVTRSCTRVNTLCTSCPTVISNGSLYSGHPILIKQFNLQSFTMLKGHMLPATQCTISTLGACLVRLLLVVCDHSLCPHWSVLNC